MARPAGDGDGGGRDAAGGAGGGRGREGWTPAGRGGEAPAVEYYDNALR